MRKYGLRSRTFPDPTFDYSIGVKKLLEGFALSLAEKIMKNCSHGLYESTKAAAALQRAEETRKAQVLAAQRQAEAREAMRKLEAEAATQLAEAKAKMEAELKAQKESVAAAMAAELEHERARLQVEMTGKLAEARAAARSNTASAGSSGGASRVDVFSERARASSVSLNDSDDAMTQVEAVFRRASTGT